MTRGVARAGCAAAALLVLVAGCGRGGQRGAGGPPEVSVATAERRAVPDRYEYVGTVRSVRAVDVRARVRGFLIEQTFIEGQRVEAGDVLFRIDPSTYQVRLAEAKGDLAHARATQQRAERDFQRAQELYAKNVVPISSLDEQRAARDEAAAAVETAEAALQGAQLDLSYTRVTSPLAGRVGLAQVDVGNLVGQDGQDTVLTRVVQLDPIYVYFSPPESDRLARRYVARPEPGETAAPGGAGPVRIGAVPVRIEMGDGTPYPHDGVVDFVDPTVDATRGTVTARAELPNPDAALKPGDFVRVIAVFPPVEAVVVPEQALQEEQGGSYVLVVKPDDTVELRNVAIGIAANGVREIAQGLEAGERVIVEGAQKARPGEKVKPVAASAAAAPAAKPEPGSPEAAPGD